MPSKINAVDELVADPVAARELGVSLMSMWRRDHDPGMTALGWPAKIRNQQAEFQKPYRARRF